MQDKHIVKNAKLFKFENDTKSKISIEKIFCGYHSCFAISVVGDIYAWGNPRNYRLTQDYGDKVLKNPKNINITWKNDGKMKKIQDDDEEDNEKEKKFDERDILNLLNSKNKVTTFAQLFVNFKYLLKNIIDNLDLKYEDDNLIKIDEEFQEKIYNIVGKSLIFRSNRFLI